MLPSTFMKGGDIDEGVVGSCFYLTIHLYCILCDSISFPRCSS